MIKNPKKWKRKKAKERKKKEEDEPWKKETNMTDTEKN